MPPIRYNVERLQVVTRALEQVDADLKREGHAELVALGQLVERDAEVLARATIPKVTRRWAEMRTGITPRVVYVVPQQKGTRGRNPRHRPNFAPLLKKRAMVPALDRKRPEVIRRYKALTARVCKAFNHG